MKKWESCTSSTKSVAQSIKKSAFLLGFYHFILFYLLVYIYFQIGLQLFNLESFNNSISGYNL